MGVVELAAAIVGLLKAIIDQQAAEFAALPADQKTAVAVQHAKDLAEWRDFFSTLLPKV